MTIPTRLPLERITGNPPALRVSELFGPTIQGEGPAAGRAAMFLRLSGCNLSCSWCDSAYTWDSERYDVRGESRYLSVNTIQERLRPHRGAVLVVTGGEPMLQQTSGAWPVLLDRAADMSMPVHVETNATIRPSLHSLYGVRQWVLSPKLPNAGLHRGHQDPAIHPAWVELRHHASVAVKFVCTDRSDVDTAVSVAVERWGFSKRAVWVMPEGTDAGELAARWPDIAEAAAAHGINASHRLHVLAWGNERGR